MTVLRGNEVHIKNRRQRRSGRTLRPDIGTVKGVDRLGCQLRTRRAESTEIRLESCGRWVSIQLRNSATLRSTAPLSVQKLPNDKEVGHLAGQHPVKGGPTAEQA